MNLSELRLSRNLGIIEISVELSKNRFIMSSLFNIVTPLKFDLDYSGTYKMICFSDQFDEFNEGEEIPKYSIEMTRSDDYEVFVSKIIKI